MGQLLVTLIIPPVVGVVTYIVLRRIWGRDENSVGVAERRDRSAETLADRSSTDV